MRRRFASPKVEAFALVLSLHDTSDALVTVVITRHCDRSLQTGVGFACFIFAFAAASFALFLLICGETLTQLAVEQFFLTGTILTFGGFATQSVGKGAFFHASSEVWSEFVGQTEVVVEVCSRAIGVVGQSVGRVTGDHAEAEGACVSGGGTDHFFVAVFFEAIVGMWGA